MTTTTLIKEIKRRNLVQEENQIMKQHLLNQLLINILTFLSIEIDLYILKALMELRTPIYLEKLEALKANNIF
ncbi:hypothetical protein EC575_21170 [Vibrio cholerae]|nr:hypothetical protein EC575_21170 [Vibrio cholerae]